MRNKALTLVVLAGLATSASIALALADDHAPKSKPSSTLPAKKDAHGAPDTPVKSVKPLPKAQNSEKSSSGDEPVAKPAPKHTPRAETRTEITSTTPAATPKSLTADDALSMLSEGNSRWMRGRSDHPSSDAGRREQTAENGQKPFATILTCADSRIPVERVFDRGVGELFVVRVAGNVAGNSETGTIEYGVGHLNTRLLVVMGHTKCGAVAAACSGAKLHGKVGELVGSITPAVERARRNNPGASAEDLPALATRENVWESIYDLMRESSAIREAVAKHEVKIVGAIYDIASGKVEFLGEHPWQRELISAMNASVDSTRTASAQSSPVQVASEPSSTDTDQH